MGENDDLDDLDFGAADPVQALSKAGPKQAHVR